MQFGHYHDMPVVIRVYIHNRKRVPGSFYDEIFTMTFLLLALAEYAALSLSLVYEFTSPRSPDLFHIISLSDLRAVTGFLALTFSWPHQKKAQQNRFPIPFG